MSEHGTITGSAASEAALVEMLHDLTLSKKGPDAVIARGLKDLMPAAIRWLEDEKARGTDLGTIGVAAAHLAISLHLSLLLNIAGSAKALAPVLPALIDHAKRRYDVSVEKVATKARTERGA